MKWYQKPIWIIVLLVLFFPVGLFLMWKYADWNKYIKWGITGLFALLFIWPWVNYALAETPAIVLSEFEVAEKTVTGSEYKLSGKVTPPSTELKVNGEIVEVKEDGSFTYNLSLKEGVNEIKIEANNSGKTAELVRKLTRELTAEEKVAKEAEEKKKAEEAAAEVAAKKAEDEKKKAEEEAKRKAEKEKEKPPPEPEYTMMSVWNTAPKLDTLHYALLTEDNSRSNVARLLKEIRKNECNNEFCNIILWGSENAFRTADELNDYKNTFSILDVSGAPVGYWDGDSDYYLYYDESFNFN